MAKTKEELNQLKNEYVKQGEKFMSKENITVELKEKELEKVNGGFFDLPFEKPQIELHSRVRVRYTYAGEWRYLYGELIELGYTWVNSCQIWHALVLLDGQSPAQQFSVADIEPA